jgi:peroxiredoxin
VGIVILFLLVFFIHPQPPLLATGAAAPAIALQTADGRRVDVFAAASHGPVLIQFFDTVCVNCREQQVALCTLAASFPRASVVEVDAGRESAAAVGAYAHANVAAPCRVTLLVDPGATVSQRYAITVVPTYYVVDSAGHIAFGGVGATGLAAAQPVLRQLAGG